MKYLFGEWGAVKERIKDKYLFVFLDFDGTLVPIARTPDKVRLSEELKTLLKEIAGSPGTRLALISGRSIGDIKNKVGLKGVIYSGNHGLEIEGPKIKFKPALPAGFRKTLEKIKDVLKKNSAPFEGVLIEDKGYSLSFHYRLARKDRIPQIKTLFHEAIILDLVRNKIKVKPGKMVWEIRPPVEWDKGKVVLWLLARQVFLSGRARILPIYIGDDVTDEDAFKALKNKGLTVFVGAPKHSCAQYYLNSPEEVGDFLNRIRQLKSAQRPAGLKSTKKKWPSGGGYRGE